MWNELFSGRLDLELLNLEYENPIFDMFSPFLNDLTIRRFWPPCINTECRCNLTRRAPLQAGVGGSYRVHAVL